MSEVEAPLAGYGTILTPDTETPEAEQDAILARLEGEYGVGADDEDDAPAPPSTEAAANEPEHAATEPASPGEDSTAPGKAAATTVDNVAIADAIGILARAGIPADMLAAASPEQKVAWAEAYKPIQAQHDNAYRELGELKKGAEGAVEAESKGVDGAAEPVVHPEVNLSTYIPAINEELGEDTAKALMAPIEAVSNYVAQVAKQIGEQLESVQGGVRGLYVSDARRQLTGAYPQLEDNDVFSQVEDLAEALVHSGKYDSMHSLFEAASKVVLADTIAAGRATKRQAEVTQRTLGQVQPPAPAPDAPAEPMNHGDIEDAAIDALERGLDPREIRRKLQL